jgi:hypothetical protein
MFKSETGVRFKENAAEEITNFLMGSAAPLLLAVVAIGTDRTRPEISKTGYFSRISTLIKIAILTFPGKDPLSIAESLVARLVEAGVATSAAASGNTARH